MKVTCQHCGIEFDTKPHSLKRGRGKYCGQQCFYDAKGATIYTDEVNAFIVKIWGKKTVKEIAEMLGVGDAGLRKHVTILRSNGVKVPYAKRPACKVKNKLRVKKKRKKTIPPVIKPTPVVKVVGKKVKDLKSLPNIERLKGSQKIHIAEHSRQIDTVIRVDHKTYIIKHKQTA